MGATSPTEIEPAVHGKPIESRLPRSAAPPPFEKLRVFYDYEKWHVGLYSGGIASTLLATALKPGLGLVMLVPAGFFIAAAAFAGTIVGNLSRFDSEDELNEAQMEIFGARRWGKGQAFRVREKVCFWLGVASLLGAVVAINLLSAVNPCP
jgi:hypothetical protein